MRNTLLDWLDQYWVTSRNLFAKRLTGNDTGVTGGHQAGPYIPKDIMFLIFPTLERKNETNPRVRFDLSVDSHNLSRQATAIWYNNELRGGSRNEVRITNLGGQSSPLLDHDNTGAITLLSFSKDSEPSCHAWTCSDINEENTYIEGFGPLDLGVHVCVYENVSRPKKSPLMKFGNRSKFDHGEIELQKNIQSQDFQDSVFPPLIDVLAESLKEVPKDEYPPDLRLLRRREAEFKIFKGYEFNFHMPKIMEGFKTFEEFEFWSKSIFQRRRARSGKSLELQVKQILEEEGLMDGYSFSFQSTSEDRKKPDFLFPNAKAYQDKKLSRR